MAVDGIISARKANRDEMQGGRKALGQLNVRLEMDRRRCHASASSLICVTRWHSRGQASKVSQNGDRRCCHIPTRERRQTSESVDFW